MEKSIKKYWPIFVLPTFAAFIIGFIVPFIEGIYLSFCKFTTIRDASFVGLSTYVEAFKDNTFTHAFGFTAVFAVVTLVLINVLAFAIALAWPCRFPSLSKLLTGLLLQYANIFTPRNPCPVLA